MGKWLKLKKGNKQLQPVGEMGSLFEEMQKAIDRIAERVKTIEDWIGHDMEGAKK